MTVTPNTAAVVTVGSELTEGLRLDTNTQHVAAALVPLGLRLIEAVSVGDDIDVLSRALTRLIAAYELVIVTGGLGPTHDDITRDAASLALGVQLRDDPDTLERLSGAALRHADPEARAQVPRMALVLEGARVIPPVVGTAPGQLIETPFGSTLLLLPGPPREMAPMLATVLAARSDARVRPRDLGITGMAESDVQVRASRVLAGRTGIGLTVLAKPGEVRVVLHDEGAGSESLERAADDICDAFGDACFTRSGETHAEAVLRAASAANLTIALAESCTGGLVSAALTDVAGASASFLGGAVTYSDGAKQAILEVSRQTLQEHGAVSAHTALEMAEGASRVFGADVAVAITGVAGPGGGSAEKPVGTVWFGIRQAGTGSSTSSLLSARRRRFPGDRTSVRQGATAFALELLRRALAGLPLPPE